MGAFAVIGATSWGVTLAALLERNGHTVALLVRTPEEASAVNGRCGIARLPELRLGPAVRALAAVNSRDVEGVIVAVPSRSFRASLTAHPALRRVPVLSATKGLEPASHARMSQVLQSEGWETGDIAVLSGPNLAHEVARGLPAAAVIASSDSSTGSFWQSAIAGQTFRAYTSADVTGVELAGSLKNVIAIAAGAAWALNFGANTVASIMTRGLAEMTRLGVALGADPLTFQGLAGVGDLAATCFSPLSRNRRFGELLAAGNSPAEAHAIIGESVEGASTAAVALELAATVGVELPIAAEVAAVVAGAHTVPQAMAGLLTRPLKGEASSGR